MNFFRNPAVVILLLLVLVIVVVVLVGIGVAVALLVRRRPGHTDAERGPDDPQSPQSRGDH